MLINFLGDSITKGVGADSTDTAYVSLVGREPGITAVGYGVSGTRIAKRTVPYREDFAEYFLLRAERMDKNADLVFVFGGTNDFGHGDAPIGDPADRCIDTFYGALNLLIERLISDYGREKLCFILPLHRKNEDDPLGDHIRDLPLGTLSDFICATVATLDRYSVDYLNLNGIFTRERLDELTADGLHPNNKGHRIIADEVIKYLKRKLYI